MTERQEKEMNLTAILKQMAHLRNKKVEIEKELMLLCDDKQWYTEAEESTKIKRRPLVIETNLIGRIHWKEDFVDESNGDVITIERSKVVRLNGEWQYYAFNTY